MVANFENIAIFFDKCNIAYFEGKLPVPMFDLLHSFRMCGYFNCNYVQGWFSRKLYDFKISITDYYDFTPEQFTDIMVHEMIHYYLAYFGIDQRCRHGKKFKMMARKLNSTYNLHITKKVNLAEYKRRKGTPLLSYWLSKII